MQLDQTVFSADSFSAGTLTYSITELPHQPATIARRRLFQEDGIPTLEAMIELIDDTLSLVPASPRGAPGDMHPDTGRRVVKFRAPHLKTRSTIYADAWQDRRGFGEKTLASVERERDRVLGEHRRRFEATLEFHRMRALAGQILDADGTTVLVDLLAHFDVAQTAHAIDLSSASLNLPNALVAAKRKSEEHLGEATPTKWVAFCSASFLDAVRAHPSVEAAVAGWSAATIMRDDVRADLGISGVQLVEVRNAAGRTFIEDGAAYLVPEGVPGLCVTHFAPADYVDAANDIGIPFYSRAELLQMGRGIAIESQSNPISFVSRPRAIVKLTNQA